jgi:hypothetical protein
MKADKEGWRMRKNKISMNETEWRCALRALNAFRNKMITEGAYTDVVDNVIMKIVNAPIRKVRVAQAQ